MATRIVLVDSLQLMREGLHALLRTVPAWKVVGQAGDGRTALALTLQMQPHLLLTDIHLRGLPSMELVRRVHDALPDTRILGLLAYPHPQLLDHLRQFGITGCITKSVSFRELASAIKQVLHGRAYLSPELAEGLPAHTAGPRVSPGVGLPGEAHNSTAHLLSAREREVLQLVSEGWSTRQIAQQLRVSTKTVDTHRLHITGKLRIYSVAGLTRYALREGLSSLEH